MNHEQHPPIRKHPRWYRTKEGAIAVLALLSLALSITLLTMGRPEGVVHAPLFLCYLLGGGPLLWGLLKKVWQREFGSDLLAGISIVTALVLGHYLAGVFVILMLSGGEAVERFAMQRASSLLDALSRRMPLTARKRVGEGVSEVALDEIAPGDLIEVLPHDIAPVDGVVRDGYSTMDESYLTGEPFHIRKAPGSEVISGAINGESLLVIEALRVSTQSRYQKIAQVIESQAGKQVPMRRLGDRLGAFYTPFAVVIALLTWVVTGDPDRFLAVLVVATPCPLIIAIPVAVVGAISSAARRAIIIKNPAVLEVLSQCKTLILDKTGTLTHGHPQLTGVECSPEFTRREVLRLVGAAERYSKHPLAAAVIEAAEREGVEEGRVTGVSERPGEGLVAECDGRRVEVTGRGGATVRGAFLPPPHPGLECVVFIDGTFAALLRFEDPPRAESRGFVQHLAPAHGISRVMILSGDREAEVQHLGALVGIAEVQGGLKPEEKLARVIEETKRGGTIYIGDGINDAPALQAATVGIALGTKSDITSEASDAVLLEPSLEGVDELIHIARRMRRVALQSAVGGMTLSILGMAVATTGFLTPLAGAITQEVIDLFAVFNALRTLRADGRDPF